MERKGYSSGELSTLLGVAVVPSVLEAAGMTKPEDVEAFYRSELYANLSDPETGMWHLSASTLAGMYREELDSGSFTIPEEQS